MRLIISQTPSNTPSDTPANTPTGTSCPNLTPTTTPTSTTTTTPTSSVGTTPTNTSSPTSTPTTTPTNTSTSTPTSTPTNTSTPTTTSTSTPTNTPESTPNETPSATPTLTPSPTEENCVINYGASMTPCFGGTSDEYMEGFVDLQSTVSVDTDFIIRVAYIPGTLFGNCAVDPQAFIDLTVTVFAGDFQGLLTCPDAPFIDFDGATICTSTLLESPYPECTSTPTSTPTQTTTNTPTTTLTATPTQTINPTSTPTSTLTATPTQTINPTSTPTTTPTETTPTLTLAPVECRENLAEVIEGEESGTVTYTECDGIETVTVTVTTPYSFCALDGTVTQTNCVVGIIGPC